MGCDIHAYIDYDVINPSDESTVHTFNLAKLNIQRDYWLFTLLAGVRGESVQDKYPVAPNKGLPENISPQVHTDAYLFVIEEGCREQGICTRSDAEKWGGNYTDKTKRYIYHPDWHSYTWLNLTEIQEVISRYEQLKCRKQVWLKEHEKIPDGFELTDKEWLGMRVACCEEGDAQIPVELLAIHSMMHTLHNNGYTVRLVCWFDN